MKYLELILKLNLHIVYGTQSNRLCVQHLKLIASTDAYRGGMELIE